MLVLRAAVCDKRRDAGIGGGLSVEGLFALLRHSPVHILHTLAQADGGILGIHEIGQLKGHLGIIAGAGDHESAHTQVSILIIAAALVALGPLQGRNRHTGFVEIGAGVHDDHGRADGKASHNVGRSGIQGLHLRGILCVAFGIHQALVVQLMYIPQAFPEFVLVQNGVHRIVFYSQVLVAVLIDEGVHQEEGGIGVPAVRASGQRDLVVGVPISVGVLLLEGLQHLIVFICGGGHFQLQVVQPALVDPQLIRVFAVVDLRIAGQGVDIAVRHGDAVLDVGDVVKQLFRIGAVLFNQVVQRKEHTSLAELHQRGVHDGGGHVDELVAAQVHVGIGAAGQGQVELLQGLRLGNLVELQINIGLLLQPFDVFVCGNVLNVGLLHTPDLQSDGGVGNPVFAPVRVFGCRL